MKPLDLVWGLVCRYKLKTEHNSLTVQKNGRAGKNSIWTRFKFILLKRDKEQSDLLALPLHQATLHWGSQTWVQLQHYQHASRHALTWASWFKRQPFAYITHQPPARRINLGVSNIQAHLNCQLHRALGDSFLVRIMSTQQRLTLFQFVNKQGAGTKSRPLTSTPKMLSSSNACPDDISELPDIKTRYPLPTLAGLSPRQRES